jgi:hypothetical protein
MTRNCKDFEILHQERIDHPGILGIYQDRNYFKAKRSRFLKGKIATILSRVKLITKSYRFYLLATSVIWLN